MIITDNAALTISNLRTCLFMTPPHYWFITSYAALYILAPILNNFIDNNSQNTIKNTLFAFFIFQTIWGWTGAAKFVEFGYSSFSFIGLYLLARYLHAYPCKPLTNWSGSIYLTSIVLNSICFYATKLSGNNINVFCYINPFVIAGATGLLLYFNKLSIEYNKTVIFISKSAFAVYLYHGHPMINDLVFFNIISYIYGNHTGLTCIALMFISLIFVYMCAVIIDQPRIWIWNIVVKYFETSRFYNWKY